MTNKITIHQFLTACLIRCGDRRITEEDEKAIHPCGFLAANAAHDNGWIDEETGALTDAGMVYIKGEDDNRVYFYTEGPTIVMAIGCNDIERWTQET